MSETIDEDEIREYERAVFGDGMYLDEEGQGYESLQLRDESGFRVPGCYATLPHRTE